VEMRTPRNGFGPVQTMLSLRHWVADCGAVHCKSHSTAVISLPCNGLPCFPLSLIIDHNGTQTRFHGQQGPSFNWFCLEGMSKTN
jgi:hypothetical protein